MQSIRFRLILRRPRARARRARLGPGARPPPPRTTPAAAAPSTGDAGGTRHRRRPAARSGAGHPGAGRRRAGAEARDAPEAGGAGEAGAADPAAPEISEIVRDTFGDWQVRCTPDGNECFMYQLALDAEQEPGRRGQPAQAARGARPMAGVTVVTPLGTLLTSGVVVQIDADEARQYPFDWCSQVGCFSRFGLTEHVGRRDEARQGGQDDAGVGRGARASDRTEPVVDRLHRRLQFAGAADTPAGAAKPAPPPAPAAAAPAAAAPRPRTRRRSPRRTDSARPAARISRQPERDLRRPTMPRKFGIARVRYPQGL